MATTLTNRVRRGWLAGGLLVVCVSIVAAACAPPPAVEPPPLWPAPTGWVEPTANLVGHVDLPTPASRTLRLVSAFPLGDGVGTLSTTGHWGPGGTDRRARLLAVDDAGRLRASVDVTAALSAAAPLPSLSSTSASTVQSHAVLADGRVAISVGTRVLMLEPDGRPSAAWGSQATAPAPGWGSTASTAPVLITSLIAQPDGSLVVGATRAGTAVAPARVVLSRLDPDGRPDPTFASGGTVELDPLVESSQPRLIRADVDPQSGSITVAWSSGATTAVTRLSADGAPDPTFAGWLDLLGAPCSSCSLADLAVDDLGRTWIAAGQEIVRLLPDGQLDETFDGDGRVVPGPGVPLPTVAPWSVLDWRGDTMLVSSGTYNLRLLDDGSLDPTIGTWTPSSGTGTYPGVWISDRVEPPDGSIELSFLGALSIRNGGLFAVEVAGTATSAFFGVRLARDL
jgi:hypothetical protein